LEEGRANPRLRKLTKRMNSPGRGSGSVSDAVGILQHSVRISAITPAEMYVINVCALHLERVHAPLIAIVVEILWMEFVVVAAE
jgi:hypothetical protein